MKTKSRLEKLSRFQRRMTPLPVCRWLVQRVRRRMGVERVAVLWVERRSYYWSLWPDVDLWGVGRDARTYSGPWPVICHPPCGPWGKYKHNCYHAREDGIIAMDMVHRWGGVVEQPLGSSLFREYGLGGEIEQFDQGPMGHLAQKPTLLYWSDGAEMKAIGIKREKVAEEGELQKKLDGDSSLAPPEVNGKSPPPPEPPPPEEEEFSWE